MAREVLQKTDKAVDRIGYWYGFFRLIWDHRLELSAVAFGGVALMAKLGYESWHIIQKLASETGYWIYPSLLGIAVLSLVGAFFAMAMLARLVRGKTWLGFERDLVTAAAPLDRIKVAEQVGAVSKRMSSIYGEWSSEYLRARNDDAEKMMQAAAAGLGGLPVHDSVGRISRKYIERYSEDCMSDVWSLVAIARKFVVMDQTALWNISHGVKDPKDLHSVIMFLGSIEASLKYSSPDLPLRNEYEMHVKQSLTNQEKKVS